jgi:hypothetical protein
LRIERGKISGPSWIAKDKYKDAVTVYLYNEDSESTAMMVSFGRGVVLKYVGARKKEGWMVCCSPEFPTLMTAKFIIARQRSMSSLGDKKKGNMEGKGRISMWNR